MIPARLPACQKASPDPLSKTTSVELPGSAQKGVKNPQSRPGNEGQDNSLERRGNATLADP